MLLNIQLIDENHNILPKLIDSVVKVNNVDLTNIGTLAEFQHTFQPFDVVNIEAYYYGRRIYKNTFKLLDFDLGNSVHLGINGNTPFQIMLVPVLNIDRTKHWVHDVVSYGGTRSLYWDNHLTAINPTPYVNKTFNRLDVNGNVNPPVMVLKNRRNVDSIYFYGVPTNTNDNAIINEEIIDNDGNVVTSINGTSITGNPEYTYDFVFPHFITYKNLLTNEIHFYNATSSVFDKITYSIDGDLFGVGTNIIKRCIKTGCDLLFRQTLEFVQEDDCNCCGQKVVYNEYDEKEICIESPHNVLDLSITQEKSCFDDECENFVINTPIIVRPSITINTPYVRKNNQCVPYCATGTVTYKRYNKDNELVDTYVDVVSLDKGDCQNILTIDSTYTYTPTIISEERIVVTYEDCYTKCEYEDIVKYCNAYRIIQNDCDDVVIENCSLVRTLSIEIRNVDTNAVLITDSIVPAISKTYNINNGKDGVYMIKITDNNVDKFYPLYNYCEIRKCALAALSQVTCNECNGGRCAEENKHDFRKLFLFGLMYFSYLEKDLALNYAYTAITTELSQDLTDASTWLKRLQEICQDINNCGEGLNICGCNDVVTLNHCKSC
jgi:hypothetical protein